MDADVQSYVQYSPFAEGHNPTEYCDYDDWEQMGWYMCEGLTSQSSPTGTSDFVRTPYQLTPGANDAGNVRCGNRVVFAEPTAVGTCAPSYTHTVNDRSMFGTYYQPLL